MSMPGIKTVLCLLLLNPVILFAQQRIEKPNIVFIMVDDLGWGELGCYGNTFNETPHLDQLARQGMRFTQAYAAAPVCSPTRASILTGRSEEHPSELQSLMPTSYAVFCLQKQKNEPIH